MQLDRFTTKAQAALQEAQRIAQQHSNQEIEGEHLLAALQALEQRVKVQGSGSTEPYLGNSLKKALDAAEAQARKLKDEYISTEHLLLGLMAEASPALKKIFQTYGLKANDVLKALAELRGNQRVTDPNPEDKFQALEKYGRDLTALARQGKIDPVIGRDDEIRRVMQVLSRRTKNNPVLIGEPGVGKTAIA